MGRDRTTQSTGETTGSFTIIIIVVVGARLGSRADNFALRQPVSYCGVLQQLRVFPVMDNLYYP
jgi:hypothetical protein